MGICIFLGDIGSKLGNTDELLGLRLMFGYIEGCMNEIKV